MFAKATSVGFAQRVVATLAACAVVLWSLGVHSSAQAANLTNISDTLETSEPSVLSGHTIAFTIPAGSSLNAADNFTITLPAAFTIDAGMAIGDFTATVAGSGVTVDNFSEASGVITLSLDTTANATEEVVVAIANTEITNPAVVGSYEIIVATVSDTGRTRVAIVDTVLVTAIVDTVFDFTITGLATSTAVNGTSTTGSTTATAVPFGNVAAGEVRTMAQQLNVTTNAANGYVVTVETDHQLLSSTGADIDSFADGGDDDTPATWAQPSNTLLDENTWGHWGITTTDNDLKGGGTDFGEDEWIAASTSPRVIMAHDDPSDGTTGSDTAAVGPANDDVGQTLIGYQIEITPLQEAGDDYEATLTYIATPTF